MRKCLFRMDTLCRCSDPVQIDRIAKGTNRPDIPDGKYIIFCIFIKTAFPYLDLIVPQQSRTISRSMDFHFFQISSHFVKQQFPACRQWITDDPALFRVCMPFDIRMNHQICLTARQLFHHLSQILGQHLVIAVNHFKINAFRTLDTKIHGRSMPCVFFINNNNGIRISALVPFHFFQCPVAAAVINQQNLQIPDVRVLQHRWNTFVNISFCIVRRDGNR